MAGDGRGGGGGRGLWECLREESYKCEGGWGRDGGVAGGGRWSDKGVGGR